MTRRPNYDDRQLMLESLGPRLLNWRAARAKAANGGGKTNILMFGDSTMVGLGSIDPTGAGVKNKSIPTKLASFLNGQLGMKSFAENCFGDFGYAASAPSYDTRISPGSWGYIGSATIIAGQPFYANSTTASPLGFTPTRPTDTCEIYYLTGATTGSFNARIGAGSNTLRSTTAGSGVNKLVLTGSLGMNTYNVDWASGAGGVFIVGFSAYNSAETEVSVLNCGYGGSTTSRPGMVFSGIANQIAAFAPSLMVYNFGINDWRLPNSIATFTANLQTINAARPATCDLIMLSPLECNPVSSPGSPQQPYLDAFREVAMASSGVYIDENARTGGWAAANAVGMAHWDGVHGTDLVYFDEAWAIAEVLLAA